MTKFKLDDRIIAYRYGKCEVKGKIILLNDNQLGVIDSAGERHYFHPKQFRKLKTKLKNNDRDLIMDGIKFALEYVYEDDHMTFEAINSLVKGIIRKYDESKK